MPMISTWRGKPTSEMTRDEIEAALIELGQMYTEAIETHADDMRLMADMMRRGREGR